MDAVDPTLCTTVCTWHGDVFDYTKALVLSTESLLPHHECVCHVILHCGRNGTEGLEEPLVHILSDSKDCEHSGVPIVLVGEVHLAVLPLLGNEHAYGTPPIVLDPE